MSVLLTEKFQDILESSKFAPVESADKSTLAQLFENHEKEMKLSESVMSADIALFTPVLMPLVRRVYPALIANELVGTQALTMPTGYLYAMTNRYIGNSVNGIKPADKGQILVVADASVFTLGGDITTAGGATGKVVYKEGNNVLVSNTSSTIFQDGDAVDNAAPFAASATTVVETYSNQSMFKKILKGYSGPMATASAEVLGDEMNEVGFNIERTMAEAKSRKLKTKYTIEFFQDLKTMHGLDAEKELMDLMAMELKLGIDREIIQAVNDNATVTADANINAYQGRWEIEKYRSLAIRLSNESRIIGQETRKGAANTVLCSGKVATALEQIGSFTLSPVKAGLDSVMGGITPAVGTFDGKYKIIVVNFATTDYMTTIYKGANNRDNGIFFAPYQLANVIKTVDPVSGQPAMLISSSYAICANPMNPETYMRTTQENFINTVLA